MVISMTCQSDSQDRVDAIVVRIGNIADEYDRVGSEAINLAFENLTAEQSRRIEQAMIDLAMRLSEQ